MTRREPEAFDIRRLLEYLRTHNPAGYALVLDVIDLAYEILVEDRTLSDEERHRRVAAVIAAARQSIDDLP